MPFITGSANSMAELQTALFNGLAANGWTRDGNVIYKGGVFVDLTVPTGEPRGENRMLRFHGGLAQTGGVLEGGASVGPRIGEPREGGWIWPVIYNLHILSSPDEVYFEIRRDLNHYQFAAFGQGNVSGQPGTGNWVAASHGDSDDIYDRLNISSTGGEFASGLHAAQAPFWGGAAYPNTVLHHRLDGGDWGIGTGFGSSVGDLNAAQTAYPQLDRSPNAWNGEAILLPLQPAIQRASSKLSVVADLAHARLLRIDNYNPEEIIDLSPDFWMVYPFRTKNTAERNGGHHTPAHTGTFGWAIRYDGP